MALLDNTKGKLYHSKAKQSANDSKSNTTSSDFIPYACHYNKNTVLTKNGELLQTIKIAGLSHEVLGKKSTSLRATIREAVMEKIQSEDFALYFHTIRKKVPLDTGTKFDSFFQDHLHKSWVKMNHWDQRFDNELYITIICSSMPISINFQNFSQMFFVEYLIDRHDKALESNAIKLNKLVDSVLETLADYSPKKLGIADDQEVGYHSELLSFFSNIVQLDSDKIRLDDQDLSRQLSKYSAVFGNNVLEIKKMGKNKFFAVMLSMKDCDGVSNHAIDKFLQMQYQFVITQTVNFTETKSSLMPYEHQKYVLDISGDENLKKISGLDRIFAEGQRKKPLTFCDTQTTIMVVARDLETVEKICYEVGGHLSNIGIPVVREDLNMENCFWSQLPGNFSYIARKRNILVSCVGYFASLYNFPFGSLNSKWGEYVTLLKTNLGTTYFFNFHVGDNGHTIIVGDAYSGKKTLLNFLLSEASKLANRIFYLDGKKESKLYIESINGTYKVLSFDAEYNTIKLNPLLLKDTDSNREYLLYWFLCLLDKYSDPSDIDDYKAAIDSGLENIFKLDQKDRKLSNISKFFGDKKFDKINKQIIKSLSPWYGEGKFAHLFDNDIDELLSISDFGIFGIDITTVHDTPMSFNLPVINYLLHYFKEYYTGKHPSILAVSDSNKVFNSVYFEQNLEYILDDLQDRNSIMVAAASFSSEAVNWSVAVGEVYNAKMATKVFLADGSSFTNISQIFNLSEEERMYLEAFDISSREFVIRQEGNSVVTIVDLSDFDVSLGILSGNKNQIKIAEDLKKKYGSEAKSWVPQMYKTEE